MYIFRRLGPIYSPLLLDDRDLCERLSEENDGRTAHRISTWAEFVAPLGGTKKLGPHITASTQFAASFVARYSAGREHGKSFVSLRYGRGKP